jgi:NADH-quinone oxidoreductase subunit G
MVVSTTDAEAVDFRRQVIEWLMLHHPHDCPVCDEGGHCLLQDLTVAGGHSRRRYRGLKRTYHNQDLGPLVQHEMNRCIQCYRCSRYYQEFTGYRDLGVMGIGNRVYFGRSVSGVLENPFAGNLIDICPTGVYTDKPSRTIGRRWDYERRASVCLHCSLGCNLTASARYRQIVRHEARPNLEVNGHFICDRGRYGYAYARAVNRPRQALASGTPGRMADILAAAREMIVQTAAQYGPGSVAVAASARSSLETLARVKQACREHGWRGPAVAPTLRQALNLKTAVGCLKPELAVSMAAVAQAHDVLVVGADPLNEAPMLVLALRQVQRRGGRVTVVDPRAVQLPFDFDHWAVHPSELAAVMQGLIQEIGGRQATAPVVSVDIDIPALARRLNGSPRPVVVCGTDILTPGEIALAADLAGTLCRHPIVAGLFTILAGANAFAAALINEDPLAIEQVLTGIEEGHIRVLLAVEADLWPGFADRARLMAALKRLAHLVVLDYMDTPLNGAAAYFLPTQPIYECGGHWINQEGRLQAADAVMAGGEPIEITGGRDHPPRVFGSRIPGGEPIPAWQAVAALAGDAGAGKTATEGLQRALRDFHPAVSLYRADAKGERIDLDKIAYPSGGTASPAIPDTAPPNEAFILLLVDRTFGTEPLSAMSPALNRVEVPPGAYLHPQTIARLGLADNENVTLSTRGGRLTLPVQADPKMAPGVLVVPRHHRLEWQVAEDIRMVLEGGQLAAAG